MSSFDIDSRYELINKRNLESSPVPLDDEAILRCAMNHSNHSPATGPDLQPDQLVWPELLFTKIAPFGNKNVQVPNPVGSFPIDYFLERDLISLVGRTNRPNDKRTILDENGGAVVEVLDVGWIYIQPEEPI
jgi:hypothetical protein